MKFHVRLTEKAEQDVATVLQWFLEQDAVAAGGKWFAHLITAVGKLEAMPERCGLAAEAADIGLEIRELLFGEAAWDVPRPISYRRTDRLYPQSVAQRARRSLARRRVAITQKPRAGGEPARGGDSVRLGYSAQSVGSGSVIISSSS